jgi:flagellar biosynthesis component FlhA
MTEHRTDPSLQDLNRGLLIAAGVLLAVASVAGLAGFATFSAALIAATRRWYHRADMAPQHLANLKWQQARAAMEAGTGAWREAEKHAHSPRSSRLPR